MLRLSSPTARSGVPGVGPNGFTLIEVMVVCAILSIALVMLSSTLASTSKLVPATRESYSACIAAANVIERLRNESPAEVWKLYNSDPADDPGGAGTAPGATFSVADLVPQPGDPDGLVGEILLPEAAGLLLESVELAALGLPRDLNGDAIVDEEDHSDDWVVLPVLVRVQWQGLGGSKEFSLATMLVREQ
jgi:prepilin-type N-terminal cleavage/methylation domain-containing protein